ncbi:peptidoglycan-binding protein [Streptomyces hawaiiensis]|uniref:Peptidoglycan-binding protein n=1 Tax=Streptomyces hawaiiensis TaxID=67305 RepID=A0A6G5RSL3_9ACTN|nr:peptidoglycan-binding protein [Streptomyces hawaiiensis]QCD60552.1 peptidoglycan-binding protein [Streptomyces hawaiiensis]
MQGDRAEARVREFAEALLALKERTPHSYETLATRLDISRSALHRYCSGRAVPADFDVVRRLARQAGADRDEVTELHRLWVLASEPRTPSPVPEPAAAGVPTPTPVEDRPVGDEALRPAATPVADGGDETPETGGSRARRWPWAVAALLAAAALAAALTWNKGGDEPSETVADNRPLFTGECKEPVRDGQSDRCVREVQLLLSRTGVTIGIDGIFGPETLRRVEAFQLRVGLNVDGIVDDDTKRALYDEDVSLKTWSKKQVADRIHEVFGEKADTAVRIARCQSFLDPLYITPNTNGTRNWGVFQISDARLRDLRGTPEKAMDPDWNIRAAHRLWAQDEDFSDWPHCAAAAEDPPPDEGGDAP